MRVTVPETDCCRPHGAREAGDHSWVKGSGQRIVSADSVMSSARLASIFLALHQRRRDVGAVVQNSTTHQQNWAWQPNCVIWSFCTSYSVMYPTDKRGKRDCVERPSPIRLTTIIMYSVFSHDTGDLDLHFLELSVGFMFMCQQVCCLSLRLFTSIAGLIFVVTYFFMLFFFFACQCKNFNCCSSSSATLWLLTCSPNVRTWHCACSEQGVWGLLAYISWAAHSHLPCERKFLQFFKNSTSSSCLCSGSSLLCYSITLRLPPDWAIG